MLIFVLLIFLPTVGGETPKQLKIVEATASGQAHNLIPSYAIDGDNNTHYHSDYSAGPKWLKLKLEVQSYVHTISVVNRPGEWNHRIIGTEVSILPTPDNKLVCGPTFSNVMTRL
eukprot:sb/3476737/